MCIGQSLSEDWVDWGAQINNGESKTISDKIFGIVCDLHMFAGDTFNNVLIKPMLTTDLNATYDDFEPYTGETITVTNETEAPAFGLKSHKGITHIISPGNVKCVYPTNESGVSVLEKERQLNDNKSDAVFDKSTGKKVVFTIENGIICAREA